MRTSKSLAKQQQDAIDREDNALITYFHNEIEGANYRKSMLVDDLQVRQETDRKRFEVVQKNEQSTIAELCLVEDKRVQECEAMLAMLKGDTVPNDILKVETEKNRKQGKQVRLPKADVVDISKSMTDA